jgi:predicted Zn finger-like uncharacterized protein
MSLVTRCPACSTAFKVVRDQLRISEGWVRCGRCSQVFDATLDLQESEDGVPHAPTTPSTAPASEAGSTPSDAAPSDLAGAVGTAPPSFDEDDFVEPDGFPMPAAPAAGWPARDLLDLGSVASPAGRRLAESEAVQTPPLSGSVSSSSTAEEAPARARAWLPFPADLPAIVADEPWPLGAAGRPPQDDATPAEGALASPVDQAVDAQLQKALRRARIQALRESRARARAEAQANSRPEATTADPTLVSDTEVPAPPLEPLMDASTSAHEAASLRHASEEPPPEAPVPAPALPSFLEAGPPVQVPAKSPRRAALLALAVLAVFLLTLQVLRHERDALAASQPGMRPVLAALCHLSGCELSPVRRIDAIRIDGSSFTPEREGGGYRLLFSLRNASPTALAMPAVELSLLDGNERPVVRRVFQPTEFGAPAVLGPRGEHAATLPLALKLPESGGVPPVVGYSLLAFYP